MYTINNTLSSFDISRYLSKNFKVHPFFMNCGTLSQFLDRFYTINPFFISIVPLEVLMTTSSLPCACIVYLFAILIFIAILLSKLTNSSRLWLIWLVQLPLSIHMPLLVVVRLQITTTIKHPYIFTYSCKIINGCECVFIFNISIVWFVNMSCLLPFIFFLVNISTWPNYLQSLHWTFGLLQQAFIECPFFLQFK